MAKKEIQSLFDAPQLDPIESHPLFHRQNQKKQTGLLYHILEGATHTRLEHARGVGQGIVRSAKYVQRYAPRQFTDAFIRALGISGKLHDLGHSAYSHQLEPLLHDDHDRRVIKIVKQHFVPAIQALDVDEDDVLAILSGVDLRGKLLYDKTLGADFLDWCARDSVHLGFQGCPDMEKIRASLVYIDGVLSVHECAINEVKAAQKHRYKLHDEGYLCMPSLICQRKLQRAGEESGIPSGQFWEMTDAEVDHALLNSENELARVLMKFIHDGPSHWYQPAVVFKMQGSEKAMRYSGFPVSVVSITKEEIKRFVERHKHPQNMTPVENKLANALGFPRGGVLIASVSYFSRTEPYDVQIYTPADGRFHSLFNEIDPNHEQSMQREANDLFAICVAVHKEYQVSVYGHAAKVERIVREEILNNCH